MRAGAIAVAALLSSACATMDAPLDARVSPDDASPADSGAASPLDVPWLEVGAPPVEAPRIPWLERGAPDVAPPVLGTCREGWRSVLGAGGAPVCEPWPESGRARCDRPHESHLPGRAGCAPIGRACPSGTWPTDLPSSAIHVDATAAPGGDGSAARPFATIGDALVAAGGAPATIALARGTYAGELRLGAGTTLRGACAAETLLTSTLADEEGAVVEIAGPDVVLEDLRIADAPRMGVRVGAGQGVTLRGVALDHLVSRAILASGAGARLEGIDLVVRDIAPRPSDGSRGRALTLDAGASGALRRAALERLHEGAVTVGAGSHLVAEDVAIAEAIDLPADGSSFAIGGFAGSRLELAGVVVEDADEHGVLVTEESAVDARDLVVRRIRRSVRGDGGIGVGVSVGSTAAIERAWIADTVFAAIVAAGEGSTATLSDAVLDRPSAGAVAQRGAELSLTRAVIQAPETGISASGASRVRVEDAIVLDAASVEDRQGVAAVAGSGSTIELHRVRARGAHLGGIAVRSSTAILEDVAVADVSGSPRGHGGVGIEVWSEGDATASLTASRVLVEHARLAGLVAAGIGEASLSDVVIRDVLPQQHDLEAGDCIALVQNRRASLARVLLARCTTRALLVGEGAISDAADVRIAGVAADALTGRTARGIEVTGELVLERGLLEDVRELGVVTYRGSRVSLRDVAIRDVDSRPLDGRWGAGIVSEGEVDLARALIERARGSGVLVSGGRLGARDLVIRDVQAERCTSTSCAGAASRGLAVIAGEADLARFRIERAVIGIQIAAVGELDLFDGDIALHLVGLNLQVPDYDLRRLEPFVRFAGNTVDFDTRYHAIPTSADPSAPPPTTPTSP